MYYAYVDPVSGSDTPTGARRSTNAATAEASPWATLRVAEAQERTNLTTLGDSLTIRCKTGGDSGTTALAPTSANWPGMTPTYQLIIEAASGHWHDGKEAAGVGFTFTRTSGGHAFAPDSDTCTLLRGIRIVAGAGRAIEKGGYERIVGEGCIFVGAWNGMRGGGSSASTRLASFKNCVFICSETGGEAFYALSYNANAFTFEHCTFVGYHSTNAAVRVIDAHTFRWCYATNRGAGGSYGGAGWAGSTRSKNASSDTSGDTSYQSIAFSTSSGGYFTNVTAGSADLSIGTSSSLKDAATDSSETVDILGATRPNGTYADIGAFEYIAVGADEDVAAAGSLSITGAAVLNATGSMAAAGAASITGAAALVAVGALLAAGSVSIAGAADLRSAGALLVTGSISIVGAADLDAVGSLVAVGVVSITGAADLTDAVTEDIAATGALSITGSADLDATGTLATSGSVIIAGAADLTSTATEDIAAVGSLSITGVAALRALGNLTAAGALSITGAATLIDAGSNFAVYVWERTA